MNECIVGIGSNINPGENVQKVLQILGSRFNMVKVSSILKTKPVGMTNQPDFLNGAVKIRTPLGREQFNLLLKNIEDEFGRDRNAPAFGPRTMDLDIVVWNGEIIDKDYYTRDFLRQTVQEVL